MKSTYLLLLVLSAVLAACSSSSGIIPDGTNSYRVMHTGNTGFTNSNTLQKNAYKEAASFCAGKGKVVETINIESKQSHPLGGWPEGSLLFNCVSRSNDT